MTFVFDLHKRYIRHICSMSVSNLIYNGDDATRSVWSARMTNKWVVTPQQHPWPVQTITYRVYRRKHCTFGSTGA